MSAFDTSDHLTDLHQKDKPELGEICHQDLELCPDDFRGHLDGEAGKDSL